MTNSNEQAQQLALEVCKAIDLERQRDFRTDAGYGIMQMENIGWTSVSSSKSNPAPGIAAVREIRDLLARWSEQREPTCKAGEMVPVVYHDAVMHQAIDAIVSLGVAASESMQHQSAAEVILCFAALFQRLPSDIQKYMEDAILRLISSLGDHVLTTGLDGAITKMVAVLDAAGRDETSAALGGARRELAQSVGVLNSRSTRVPERN